MGSSKGERFGLSAEEGGAARTFARIVVVTEMPAPDRESWRDEHSFLI